MRLINFLIIMFVIMVSLVSAQTLIPEGQVTGIWDVLNSPYIIQGNINIPENNYLIMQPGTQVYFDSGFGLTVYGLLNVNGDSVNNVSIDSGNGIYFNSITDPAGLSYCKLNRVSLHLGTTATVINHCTLDSTIYATGSSNNELTNSRIYKVIGGSNWLIDNDSIDYTIVDSVDEVIRYVCVENASGIFTNNIFNTNLTNNSPDGTVFTAGFANCNGTFKYNTLTLITPTAPLGGDSASIGIVLCSGICSYNCFETKSSGVSTFTGSVINCSFLKCRWRAVNNLISGNVKNCIFDSVFIATNGYVENMFTISYSTFWLCNYYYNAYVNVQAGNDIGNPNFINKWYLPAGVWPIDHGDPNPIYNDPDGTRNDKGAKYFPHNTSGCAPENVIIPPQLNMVNGPNPFTNTTNLKYQVPISGNINLSIYDINGRLIQTLAKGWKEPGEYNTNFNGMKLPSGIYFSVLKQGNAEKVNKMVLVK